MREKLPHGVLSVMRGKSCFPLVEYRAHLGQSWCRGNVREHYSVKDSW